MNDVLICKYCGHKGKQLHQHLKAVHNQTIKEYRAKFGEYELSQIGFNPKSMDPSINGMVECKICKKMGKNLAQHIIYHHNMSINQYRQLYPLARISVNNKSCFKHNKATTRLSKEQIKKWFMENDMGQFLGQTGPFKLYNTNPSVYDSLLFHTNEVSKKLRITLQDRITFIILDYSIKDYMCKCGSSYTKNKYCRKCKPTYPSYQWFIWKNPKATKEQYQNFKEKNVNNKCKTLNNLITEFGDQVGKEKYMKYWKNVFQKRNGIPYSNKSTQLFNQIFKRLGNKLVYYGGHNKQWKQYLTLHQKLICGQTVYCLDFKCGNKNIEFDGTYWHKNKNKDLIRDQILRKRGYQILRISQEDFDRNKELIIQTCLEFLK